MLAVEFSATKNWYYTSACGGATPPPGHSLWTPLGNFHPLKSPRLCALWPSIPWRRQWMPI